jgi:hypothetical protein
VFFETSNVTGPFDAQALQVMAKSNLVVLEKAYNYPAPGFAEDKLLGALAALRAARPDHLPPQTILFYYNSNLDCPDYHLHAVMAAHAPNWWLRNSTGDPIAVHQDSGAGARPAFPYKSVNVFDHRIAEVLRIVVTILSFEMHALTLTR